MIIHATESMELLIQQLDRKGFFAEAIDNNTLSVLYNFSVKGSTNVMMGEILFEGNSVEELRTKIDEWICDKNIWVRQNKYIVMDIKNPYNFDLQYELLYRGFKTVKIFYEDSNFVDVSCKYCYYNENGEFKYDGVLELNDVGDKFQTLSAIDQWILEHKEFVQCKNKL